MSDLQRRVTFTDGDDVHASDLHALVDQTDISPKAVTNAKLADMLASTIKGALVDGSPSDLSVAQARQLLGIDTTTTIQTTYTQAAHGFTVGQMLRYNGTIWVLAQADTISHSRAIGIIQAVTTDTFELVTQGLVTLPISLLSVTTYVGPTLTTQPLQTLIPGTVYYLDSLTAGALSIAVPEIAIIALVAVDTTTAWVFLRPDVVVIEPERTTVADIPYTILPSDRLVALTSITAPRIFTLPAANTMLPGSPIRIMDESGNVNGTATLTIIASGADTINGLSGAGTGIALTAGYGAVTLYSDGISKWLTDWNKGLRNRVLLTASAGTWTVPPGVSTARVLVIGGGGAGGACTGNVSPAAGGGAGGEAESTLTGLIPATTIAFTVGAGGVGVVGAVGGNGGVSTFAAPGGILTANGGVGGPAQINNSSDQIGGIGGTATGGQLNKRGQAGANSANGVWSGGGGDSRYGSGGHSFPALTAGTGNAGQGYGSGGGGSGHNSNTYAGGNGAPGVIIIEY